jgi:hypothetical protein
VTVLTLCELWSRERKTELISCCCCWCTHRSCTFATNVRISTNDTVDQKMALSGLDVKFRAKYKGHLRTTLYQTLNCFCVSSRDISFIVLFLQSRRFLYLSVLMPKSMVHLFCPISLPHFVNINQLTLTC